MTLILTPSDQAKILTPAILRIMKAVHAKGEARVVGGVVRDVLIGRKTGDIDLATTVPPQQMIDILTAEGIKTVPTGLAHGTITAVIDHIGYEITTLRRDVETDGRHAQVAFTDNWQEDAARRDFTCNALYLDQSGVVYDYFGGIEDARASRVKFIGDARARIHEDVLRILRFFRFLAFFGREEADSEGLSACRSLANLIPTLSAERIAREVLKLLAAQNPLPAWKLMCEAGVTDHVITEAKNLTRLKKLLDNENKYQQTTSSLARLAALIPEDAKIASAIAARLKFSKQDNEKLSTLAVLPKMLGKSPTEWRRALYRTDADKCHDAVLMGDVDIASALATIATWENPVFPIRGEDLVALKVPVGPQMGNILRQTEEWWIAGDFHADRQACLAQAKQYGKIR